MTSPDNTQNAQGPEKVCALCLTVGGGHNDPTCPAKHSDTQNDTSELDPKDLISEAIYSVPYDGLKPGQDERVDYYVRAIAQREQAAELRGFMLGQGYTFVATPGVSYANGYYEKAEDDGTTTVCNEYIAQQKFLQATKPEKKDQE